MSIDIIDYPEHKISEGYEKFLIVKSTVLKKMNRSEHSFNKLDKKVKQVVIEYANSNIADVLNDEDSSKKFSEFSTHQKLAIIDSMNELQKAFRHIPRWLSETDAL